MQGKSFGPLYGELIICLTYYQHYVEFAYDTTHEHFSSWAKGSFKLVELHSPLICRDHRRAGVRRWVDWDLLDDATDELDVQRIPLTSAQSSLRP